MLKAKVELGELNISQFDDDSDVGAMTAAYSQLPIMSDYRLLICTVQSRSAADMKRFLAHVHKNRNPSTLVALEAPTMPSAIGANIELVEYVNCSRLDKPMIIKWIAAKAKTDGISIAEDAASLLADYCLNNLTRIEVELNKLADVKCGEMINSEDVEAFVVPDGDFKIYELGDALAGKNTERTFAVYNSLLQSTPPVSILGALYSHFRRLLYAATGKFEKDVLARYLRVKPFAVDMALRQARLYTPVKLKKIVDKLSAIDADFKSGQIEDKLALDCFIAEMLCS